MHLLQGDHSLLADTVYDEGDELLEHRGTRVAQVELGEQVVLVVRAVHDVDLGDLREGCERALESGAFDRGVAELLELTDLSLSCNVKVLLLVLAWAHSVFLNARRIG